MKDFAMRLKTMKNDDPTEAYTYFFYLFIIITHLFMKSHHTAPEGIAYCFAQSRVTANQGSDVNFITRAVQTLNLLSHWIN